MNVFTRSIGGWQLSCSLEMGLTLYAPERALSKGTPEIHHSDQGFQYAATASMRRLQDCAVALSMAAISEPWDNG
jgi:hypothetical protein